MTNKRRWLRRISKNKLTGAGFVLALLLISVAVCAPWVSPYAPSETDVYNQLARPSRAHLFGTDYLGRDVLSRVIFGSRVSLLVGVSATALAATVGTLLGLISGLSAGGIRTGITALIDMLMSFPDLVFGLLLMVILGGGLLQLSVALGFLMAPRFARLVDAAARELNEEEFLLAARAVGAGTMRVAMRHVLPNIIGDVAVMSSLMVSTAIGIEASLSFLGLGVSPPTPTWGNIIRSGIEHLEDAPWVSAFSGLAILLAILAFNMLGDGARDVLDPRSAVR